MLSADDFCKQFGLRPGQKKNVGPNLDPNCLTGGIPERFFEKTDLEKNQQMSKSMKIHMGQRVNVCTVVCQTYEIR